MITQIAIDRPGLFRGKGDADAPGLAERVRIALVDPLAQEPFVDEHVRVRIRGEEPWLACGDVLIGHGGGPHRALSLARSWPGALVVAVHDHDRCWLRLCSQERLVELRADDVRRPLGERDMERDWEFVASLAHSCLVAGLTVDVLVAVAAGDLRRSGSGFLGLQATESAARDIGLPRL
ncbi:MULTISPECIES: hypothetical protein [Streptomyces]|uniref:Uncharacterized protein n=1 Tax=Streptomyces doudnae TaxID=3075536 RepID=A0ABD5EVG7_9ACTN|nr:MULTISPECIES: hypothetical protein [unclassified Streptomyces]MDT0438345.1 hypothetical protein [Streptomyces sp. DSM 41981]MYQ65535.1 hypothetical protein [Streptomyces sp. SID4950]SCE01891.1 hypothetical protein GA0115242_119644 [Streptomyces sp. SolWspMP-5a-2]